MDLEGFEVKVHGKFGLTPKQAEPGSAGYDLYVPDGHDIHMPYNSRRMVDTGVIVQTPIKLFLLMVPRSSTGTKRGKSVRIANTLGIIDPSYQGQDDVIKVMLEREDRKKEYVGTVEWKPSPTNSTILAQANKRFGIAMTPDETDIVEVADHTYDIFTFSEKPSNTLCFEAGTRFVQILFIPYARPDLLEAAIEDFDLDARGGFGSTGTS